MRPDSAGERFAGKCRSFSRIPTHPWTPGNGSQTSSGSLSTFTTLALAGIGIGESTRS